MPGGVAGARPVKAAPYADRREERIAYHFAVLSTGPSRALTLVSKVAVMIHHRASYRIFQGMSGLRAH
jgi:hypothetical protein